MSNSFKNIKLVTVNDTYDNIIRNRLSVDWSVLCEMLSTHIVSEDKMSQPFFCLGEFKTKKDKYLKALMPDKETPKLTAKGQPQVGRYGGNMIEMYAIVLDIDKGFPIEQFKQRFADYEYFLYTSASHQKEGIDRYRAIFPLDTPIPHNDYVARRLSFVNDERWVDINDPSSFACGRFFYIPTVHPSCKDKAVTFRNEGKCLDWTGYEATFNPDDVQTGDHYANPTLRSENVLEEDDVVRTAKGTIRVGDVNKHIGGVYCPFHPDKSPGAFISKSRAGNIFLNCHRCGTAYMKKREKDSWMEGLNKLRKKQHNTRTYTKEKETKIEKLVQEVEREVFAKPKSREERHQMLMKYAKKFKQYNLLQSYEGFGKSRLAAELAKMGHKILFCCKSNKQAKKQYDGFVNSLGENFVYLSKSKQFRLEEIGVMPAFGKKPNPWSIGRILKRETLKNIKDEQVRALIEEILGGESDRIEPIERGIVVTTHYRGAAQIEKFDYVFFDDVSNDDFFEFIPAKKSVEYDGVDVVEVDTVIGTKMNYWRRPKETMLGLKPLPRECKTKIVYTTTEIITSDLIRKRVPSVYCPEMFPKENKMECGPIEFFPTSKTGKGKDGEILLWTYRLGRQYDFLFIADGLGQEINHITNKGMNNLKTHLLIEISQPHPYVISNVCVNLGLGPKDAGDVKDALMLDQMHQAMGRDRAYRYTDEYGDSDLFIFDGQTSCVVLVDGSRGYELFRKSRYKMSLKPTSEFGKSVHRLFTDYPTKLRDRDLSLFLKDFGRGVYTKATSERVIASVFQVGHVSK